MVVMGHLPLVERPVVLAICALSALSVVGAMPCVCVPQQACGMAPVVVSLVALLLALRSWVILCILVKLWPSRALWTGILLLVPAEESMPRSLPVWLVLRQ